MYKSITINGGSIGRVISNNQVIWSKSKANPINKLVLPDGRYGFHNWSKKISYVTNSKINNHENIKQIEFDSKRINATFELIDEYNSEFTYLIETTQSDLDDFLYNFIGINKSQLWIQKTNPRPVYGIR